MPDIGVSLRPVGRSVVVGRAGDHTAFVDRPREKEGTDAGPWEGSCCFCSGAGAA